MASGATRGIGNPRVQVTDGEALGYTLRPMARARKTRSRAKPVIVEVPAEADDEDDDASGDSPANAIRVRRMHRRDMNRVWEFLKLVFREVNRDTVEYQRPRSKKRFEEQYDDEGIEQLIFEVDGDIVGYAECAYEVTGNDNWMNPRYFDKRDMRPLFVEELASHPNYHGRGIGSFMLEQLQHLARVRGCTHLVLEVAENNRRALSFYRKRNFFKLDASLFMAQKVDSEPELLPPRLLKDREGEEEPDDEVSEDED
jgi:ribosomal protein S18 acetylase RimI-like enzyme